MGGLYARLTTNPTKPPNLTSVYQDVHYQFQSLNMSRLDSLLIGPHWTSRLYLKYMGVLFRTVNHGNY